MAEGGWAGREGGGTAQLLTLVNFGALPGQEVPPQLQSDLEVWRPGTDPAQADTTAVTLGLHWHFWQAVDGWATWKESQRAT